jgi:ABC-type transporter Mla subunit MlaD
MVVKKSSPASKRKVPAEPTAGQAWKEVLARMSDLGDAMAQWTKVATHEADAKQKLDEVLAAINDMAKEANATLGEVESSKLGRQVMEDAEQTGQALGDAARRVREATQPHVKMAFAELSDAFGKAAAKMSEPTPEQPKAASTPAKRKAPSKKK